MKKVLTVMAALMLFAGVAKVSATPSETISLTINDKESCRIMDRIATEGKVKFTGKNITKTYGLAFVMKDLTSMTGYYGIDKVDVANCRIYKYNADRIDTIRMARLMSKVAIKAGQKANSYTVDIPLVGVDSIYYEITFDYADPEAKDTVNIQSSKLQIFDQEKSQAPYEFKYTLVTDTVGEEGYMLMAKCFNSLSTPYGSFNTNDGTLEILHFKILDKTTGKYVEKEEFSANLTVAKNGTVVTMTGSLLTYGDKIYVLNVTGNATGVDETIADDIAVYTEGRTIVISGAEGELVALYDMSGKMICSGNEERFTVAPGIYVVSVKGVTRTVLVTSK